MELESSTTKIFDISIPLQMLKTTKPKPSQEVKVTVKSKTKPKKETTKEKPQETEIIAQ